MRSIASSQSPSICISIDTATRNRDAHERFLLRIRRHGVCLLDQEPRHLVMPKIEGKPLGVSQDINAKAAEAHRAALEAWKDRVGWRAQEEARDALLGRSERC